LLLTQPELQKQALTQSKSERQQLIDTLMHSFTTTSDRAPFGCMQGTGEILEDIVAPALTVDSNLIGLSWLQTLN